MRATRCWSYELVVTLRQKALVVYFLCHIVLGQVIYQLWILNKLIIVLNNELMLQQPIYRPSLFGIFLQHALYEVLQLGRHAVNHIEVWWRIRPHRLRLYDRLVCQRVGRLPDDHLIYDHSECPDVRRERVGKALQPLGRHVSNGANLGLSRLELLLVHGRHALAGHALGWEVKHRGWHACAHYHHWVIKIHLLEGKIVLRVDLLSIAQIIGVDGLRRR